MVETRRSSSASKSFSASSSSPELSSHLHSLPSDLRSRSMLLLNLGTDGVFVCERAMDTEKTVLTDVPVMEISLEADTNPKADVVPTPTIAGEVVTDGEKSKAGKNRAKDPWAKLLSEYSQNPHRIMRGPVFTVRCRGCDLSITPIYAQHPV
ncbi:hypothetical protein F2Q68_00018704 [Brassica cretica]|uniref:Uncharacterized protein n=1 Tax=Brassica cretica TaxID=69181 RepID=A0A8S9G4D8_BRACR|nr:hypothetical protein F2Q68_00018704 [Brassica cretica]